MERQRGLDLQRRSWAVNPCRPLRQPVWLMGLIVIISAVILYRFFDTKYLTYSICALAALYGVGLLPFLYLPQLLPCLFWASWFSRRGADDLNTYLYYIISTAWAGVLVIAYLHQVLFLNGYLWNHRSSSFKNHPAQI